MGLRLGFGLDLRRVKFGLGLGLESEGLEVDKIIIQDNFRVWISVYLGLKLCVASH